MGERIGIIAATCTTVAYLTQVIKTIKSNDTSGISVYMYVIFVLGMAMWVV